MHQQSRGRRLAATGLADDAEGLARLQLKGNAIDGLHDGLGAAEQSALEGKMLGEVFDDQKRLGAAGLLGRLAPWPSGLSRQPETIRDCRQVSLHLAHSRTSMAWRRPSLIRLKHIEVMKIITPGRAATSGDTHSA